ncbi:MAG: hypothetical protein ACM3X0_09420 [Bacteroidota bacterium]
MLPGLKGESSLLPMDRRVRKDKRSCQLGPPPGMAERRLNIERRIFDLDFRGNGGSSDNCLRRMNDAIIRSGQLKVAAKRV